MARFHHPAMGGSLKFKGDDPNKKKKRKKSKLSEDVAAVAVKDDAEAGSSQAVVTKTKKAKKEEQEAARNALAQAYDQLPESGKTEAEKRFEKEQLKRLAKRAEKEAHRSHKDRVAEFNSKLESLSEHHDIPKVGPG